MGAQISGVLENARWGRALEALSMWELVDVRIMIEAEVRVGECGPVVCLLFVADGPCSFFLR
jgi:hypothetical protein